MILTVDLGTSTVKVGLWSADGLVSMGRAPIATHRPAPGRAEQDPSSWLAAVNDARPASDGPVEAIAFSSARETFVPVDTDGAPLGPAILWSDARNAAGDPRFCVSPRDYVVWQMTGVWATDPTIASLSHCPVGPPEVASTAIVGTAGDIPVVIGAGDRQCEVLGTGATEACPMVSWGTTANLSFPTSSDTARRGARITRAAFDGFVVEGGISAAGALMDWLAGLGIAVDRAADSPPGANGVIAVPWLDGARAPWWRPTAAAALVHLSTAHTAADIARAAIESVAWEIRRLVPASATALVLAGAGSSSPLWPEILAGITGLPVISRRCADAASVGAALIGARALGHDWSVDQLNPIVGTTDPTLADTYAALLPGIDEVAARLIDL